MRKQHKYLFDTDLIISKLSIYLRKKNIFLLRWLVIQKIVVCLHRKNQNDLAEF